MKSFLKEFWPWILVPFLAVLALLVVAWWLGGGEGTSPFVYNFF
ncbi:MAG: hypothetical protein AB1726_02460 [Planctomycetota bacterium]